MDKRVRELLFEPARKDQKRRQGAPHSKSIRHRDWAEVMGVASLDATPFSIPASAQFLIRHAGYPILPTICD